MRRSHLRGLLLGVTCCTLFACQGVQPVPNTPVRLDSNADIASSATFENGERLDVLLEAVDEPRPEVWLHTRNPFRFGQASSAMPFVVEPAAPGLSATEPAAGTPIVRGKQPLVQLQMIGLIEASDSAGRIAVLTDGTHVFHGRPGDIVEGQYRLLDVQPTSVEFESLTSDHRQVIDLSPR